MAGVGVRSLLNGLPGLIARELAETNKQKWSWRTHAHVGYSIKQLYQALETTPLNYVANLTLIAIGGNDTFYLTKISTWLHYLEKLCDLILRTNPTSKIVFASLPPAGTFPSFGKHMRAFIGGQNDLLTSTLDEYCSNQSDDISFVQEPVVFEEYAQRAGGETTLDDLFCDGYHPSAITYRLWAEDICQHIKWLYKQL
jgi:lysophospholipase L1-like esterase